MVRDIDLNSDAWCDLVFEGKNQNYGAYYLRKTSSRRHIRSMIIVAVAGLALIFLPSLIQSVIPKAEVISETTEVDLSALDMKEEVHEENQIKQLENVPPPPQLKETVKLTPPVIKADEEVADDDLMKTQEELTESKVDISVANVEGVKEGGIDIADLKDHQVVVQEEKKPQVLDRAEVPPQFPGGEKELFKWLNNALVYPTIAQEQGIQGRVTLRFVVTPDGSIDQVEIVKSLDPSCDKEAMRVVKKMPKWTPGKQNGIPVYVYFTLPVFFQLKNN